MFSGIGFWDQGTTPYKSAKLVKASTQYLLIDNQSNAIDTAFRSATPTISITGWFRLDATTGDRTIFGKYKAIDSSLTINVDTSGVLMIYGTNLPGGTTTVYRIISNASPYYNLTSSNGWVHYAFVYDYSQTTAANICKFYLNATEITTWSTNVTNTTTKRFCTTTEVNRAKIMFGNTYDTGVSFSGNLDDSTFWDKALSSAEVSEIYNSGKYYDISLMSSYATNCLGWWKMGNGEGDTWNGSTWTIKNIKGTANTDLTSVNLSESSIVADGIPV